jgi:hypothetical protein
LGVVSEWTGPFQVNYSQAAQDGGIALLGFEERELDSYTIPGRSLSAG